MTVDRQPLREIKHPTRFYKTEHPASVLNVCYLNQEENLSLMVPKVQDEDIKKAGDAFIEWQQNKALSLVTTMLATMDVDLWMYPRVAGILPIEAHSDHMWMMRSSMKDARNAETEFGDDTGGSVAGVMHLRINNSRANEIRGQVAVAPQILDTEVLMWDKMTKGVTVVSTVVTDIFVLDWKEILLIGGVTCQSPNPLLGVHLTWNKRATLARGTDYETGFSFKGDELMFGVTSQRAQNATCMNPDSVRLPIMQWMQMESVHMGYISLIR